MAIEVLQGKGYTYWHDLESFSYVFVCVFCGYKEAGDEAKPEPNL